MSSYEGWARLELMGHRQRVGFIKEAECYGGKMLRIDIPVNTLDGESITEFYGCTSIYALTPISEDVARTYVRCAGDPRPIKPVEFRLTDQSPPRVVAETAEGDEEDIVF